MKDCVAMVIELPGYVSGRLSAAETGPVRAHLALCAGCRSEVTQLERLDQLLSKALPSIKPSPGFASTFANRLAAERVAEEEAASHGWLGWLLQPWLIPVAAAAVLAAVMFTPWFSERTGGPLRLPKLPGVSSGGVASSKKPAAEPKVASAAPSDKGAVASSTVASSNPPSEVLQRPELFVDYSVIRDLDILESGKGDTESHAG
jgi:anti-sigma factor RsiW